MLLSGSDIPTLTGEVRVGVYVWIRIRIKHLSYNLFYFLMDYKLHPIRQQKVTLQCEEPTILESTSQTQLIASFCKHWMTVGWKNSIVTGRD